MSRQVFPCSRDGIEAVLERYMQNAEFKITGQPANRGLHAIDEMKIGSKQDVQGDLYDTCQQAKQAAEPGVSHPAPYHPDDGRDG